MVVSFSALAMNDSNCSRLRNKGVLKTYKYMGVGSQSWASLSTKEWTTKSSGPSCAESTTYASDPLAFYSMCESAVNEHFSQTIQKNFSPLAGSGNNPGQIVEGLNQMIKADSLLSRNCLQTRI